MAALPTLARPIEFRMPADQPPLLEMTGITKRFLDVTANRDVRFHLAAGEICALLGENGAGKTTLMNILFGYYQPDAGTIRIAGQPAVIRRPKDALALGVRMIHQHFALVPSMTVLENVVASQEGEAGFFLRWAAARRRLLALEERFSLHVDPDRRVADLSVGEQQRVEILKALYGEARILIMDEPTAVLAPAEVAGLFRMLRVFAGEGRSVVFISHKLPEVMAIADRVVVLRNGAVAAERRAQDTRADELAELMVGAGRSDRLCPPPAAMGATVLRLDGLSVVNRRGLTAVSRLDLEVREREILGVAGVSGNGQQELAEVLFGLRRPAAGRMTLNGRAMPFAAPAALIGAGVARIPEDRIATGLMMDLSVEDNLILERHATRACRRRRWLDHAAIRRYAEQRITEYAIRTAGREAPVRSLSGGNLQKVILARELDGAPALIVAAQPTRGLDVGAARFIHAQLLAARDRGAAVLLISDDLDELLEISDRIVVMYEGQIVGEAAARDGDRGTIGKWMSGVIA